MTPRRDVFRRFDRARRLARYAPVGIALGLLVGCAVPDDAQATDQAESDLSSGEAATRAFRDDFVALLRRGGTTEADAKKLVLLPPARAIAPRMPAAEGDALLRSYDAAYASVHPRDFYAEGLRVPVREPADLESTFTRSGPVHVLLVPGIFGEFIDARPFEELLSSPTSAARSAFARAVGDAAGMPSAQTSMFRLGSLSTEPVALDRAIDVSSLDDASGTPFVTLSYLRPASGSLETLGSVEESTATYLPRVDRWFELMGRPRNVVVMGYSRGAAVALDLVATAARSPDEHPFVRRVAAVASLAGVLYGSQLADGATTPGNPTADVMHEIEDLAAHLHPCDPSLPLATGVAHRGENTARWTGTLAKIGVLLTRLPTHPELDREAISTASADYGRLAKMVARIAFDDALDLDRPFADYCGNVLRFQRIARDTMSGVRSLTTTARLAWWRENVLPQNVRLFALTATMADATIAEATPSALLTDPAVYDARSLDFKTLRSSFYDLYDASGVDLNDSQVTLSRARFFPELFSRLNPAQGTPRSTFLGTLGTHHWGLAFPRAIPTNDGVPGNPFPRTLLLRAIATSISRSIAQP